MPGPAAIDDARVRLTDTLLRLVAFDTESRTPNLALIQWISERLEADGARTTVLESTPGRANLIASFGPRRVGGLMLSGHTDVVPAGAGWSTDPYAMAMVGDSLYGRGTADMKGFIAAVVCLSTRLVGTELTRPLHVVLSFDEEIGCVGVRGALKVLGDSDDVRPDVIVIGEPTMMHPRHSHMGKLAYEIVCRAVAGHSSLSHSMPSAIAASAKLITALSDLQALHRPNGEAEVTFNCGSVLGGGALNVIAERCTFTFECRHTVDHDPDELLIPLWRSIDHERDLLSAAGGSIEVNEITRYPALRTPADDRWLGIVERIADVGPATSLGFGTEGGLFSAALGATIVICGPGDIAVAHRPDEYVTIEQLLRCERFLGELVQHICVDGELAR